MGFVVFEKYKLGNNDFIAILGSENLNPMMFTTNYCSNPTVNVPVGSITHTICIHRVPVNTEHLNITPVLLTVSGDLILVSKFIY